MLGNGARADTGSGDDLDLVALGGGEIDVVRAGTPDGKQAQLWAGLEDSGGEARRGANVQNDFGEVDAVDQVVFGSRQRVVICEGGTLVEGREDGQREECLIRDGNNVNERGTINNQTPGTKAALSPRCLFLGRLEEAPSMCHQCVPAHIVQSTTEIAERRD